MKKISQEEQYKNLLVIITGLLVIGLINKKLGWNIAGIIIGLIGVIVPIARYYIVFAWIKLGEAMGKVSSTIILSVIFFLVLWPVSIAYKLTGKDPLQLQKQKGSLFIERNHLFVSGDLKNLW
jgi:hypothetical protein